MKQNLNRTQKYEANTAVYIHIIYIYIYIYSRLMRLRRLIA